MLHKKRLGLTSFLLVNVDLNELLQVNLLESQVSQMKQHMIVSQKLVNRQQLEIARWEDSVGNPDLVGWLDSRRKV